MLAEIYIRVGWWFSAPRDQLAIFCNTSKNYSLSAPWPFWSFGLEPRFLCTSSSLLISLQPSVFVLLTHSVEHHTVVFCVCSGKWCASRGVLMTCCSNDSSLRRDLGREYLCENHKLWQVLAIRMQNAGAGKGHPWFCNRNRETVEKCHSLLARIRLEYKDT